jgi:hypothetical protein
MWQIVNVFSYRLLQQMFSNSATMCATALAVVIWFVPSVYLPHDSLASSITKPSPKLYLPVQEWSVYSWFVPRNSNIIPSLHCFVPTKKNSPASIMKNSMILQEFINNELHVVFLCYSLHFCSYHSNVFNVMMYYYNKNNFADYYKNNFADYTEMSL